MMHTAVQRLFDRLTLRLVKKAIEENAAAEKKLCDIVEELYRDNDRCQVILKQGGDNGPQRVPPVSRSTNSKGD